MNWEESKVLTPLKRDFLKAFFEREKRFFLTGGSALGVFYLQHRWSYDLDLFSAEAFEWLEVDAAIRDSCRQIHAEVEALKSAPFFRRYGLKRGAESEIVDVVCDLNPQVDAVKNRYGAICVDTLHEILLNKICTLVSRCEIKDLLDLYFLDRRGFRAEEHLHEAQRKDGGLDAAMISHILAQVQVAELPEYLAEAVSLDDLRAYVERLRVKLAELSFPKT
jgi:hypothetical protein